MSEYFKDIESEQEAIGVLIGAASVCWMEYDDGRDKVFDTREANELREQFYRWLNEHKIANLGLATTQQLIEELAARARVSATIGEEWPHYRTVGP